jgi:hypothetical protein
VPSLHAFFPVPFLLPTGNRWSCCEHLAVYFYFGPVHYGRQSAGCFSAGTSRCQKSWKFGNVLGGFLTRFYELYMQI